MVLGQFDRDHSGGPGFQACPQRLCSSRKSPPNQTSKISATPAREPAKPSPSKFRRGTSPATALETLPGGDGLPLVQGCWFGWCCPGELATPLFAEHLPQPFPGLF